MSLAAARDRGLSGDGVERLAAHDPERRRALEVGRVAAGSPAADAIQPGDLLLGVDGAPVTSFREVERAAQRERVSVTLLRDGVERTAEVATLEFDGIGTRRALLFGGGLLQPTPYAAAIQRGVPPEGVYVAGRWYGSPVDRHGLRATRRILAVGGAPTPDLDAFLAAVRDVPDRGSVQLLTEDLEGKREVLTLDLDLRYWPTRELRFTGEGWQVLDPSPGTRSGRRARRHELAGEHPAFGELALVEHEVRLHAPGALAQVGHAAAAVALLAGRRRLEARPAEGLHHGVAHPVGNVVLSLVEADPEPLGGPLAGGELDGGGVARRTVGGVLEALDRDALRVHAEGEERALHDVHERRRTAEREVVVELRPEEVAHGRRVGEAVLDVEAVHDLEAPGLAGREGVELRAEDDRGGVAVRVEEPHSAPRRRERRLGEGDDGRDAAPAGEERETRGAVGEQEAAGRAHHLEAVALPDGVVHPVRDAAAGHALHGHLPLAVDARGARERVAADEAPVAHGQAEREELARLVGERVAELRRDLEHEGAGVGRFLDDLGHAERVVGGLHDRASAPQAREAADRRLRLGHDLVDDLGAGADVADRAGALARGHAGAVGVGLVGRARHRREDARPRRGRELLRKAQDALRVATPSRRRSGCGSRASAFPSRQRVTTVSSSRISVMRFL